MNRTEKVARAIARAAGHHYDGWGSHYAKLARAAMKAMGLTVGERACGQCGTVFEFGTGTGRRSTAKFCSPTCRKYHWRDANRLQAT